MTSLNNLTEVTHFLLLGLTDDPGLQLPLFLIFLLIYTITLVRNLGLILLIVLDSCLHTPMYIFLGNLSLVDFCYSSTVTPKVIAGFLTGDKIMSYNACASQMFFFANFGDVENYLLVSMAYDRYVAICWPLRYPVMMTTGFCVQLTISSWVSGFTISMAKVYFISRVAFCGNNVLNHFFCDVSPILKLACMNLSMAETVDFALAIVILIFPLSATVLSYGFIVSTVLQIPSATGQRKAFSTCASHLTVVVIFYTAVIFMYVRPRAIASFNSNKLISAIYAVFTPMLNPIIYCLRNKEVKDAIRKTIAGGRAPALGESIS